MKIFTFTSIKGNYCDGEYDFMADRWAEAFKMAINFEEIHNKGASNENYKIEFDINRNLHSHSNSVRVTIVKPGFINIRGRKYNEKFIKLLN